MNNTQQRKKKRNLRIFLIVIALLATGIFVRYRIKIYQAKWGCISQCVMDDFNGDGKQDMLINYCSHNNHSSLRLVDVETGNTHWKLRAKRLGVNNHPRVALIDNILILSYIYHDWDDDEKNRYKCGIEAFNTKNGEKIWETPIEEAENGTNLLVTQHEDKLYLIKRRLQAKTKTLYSINPVNGTINWQIDMPGIMLTKPLVMDKDKLIINDLNSTFLIDPLNKILDDFYNNAKITTFYKQKNNEYLFVKDSLLFRYDTAVHGVYFKGKQVSLSRKTDYSYNGVYKGNLVSVCNSAVWDSTGRVYMEMVPFQSNKKGYLYPFDEEIKHIQTVFYGIRAMYTPEYSAFHNISNRFIPLVANTVDKNQNIHKKLLVFDLDSAQVKAKSTAVDDVKIIDLVSHRNHYVLHLEYFKDNKQIKALALINGESGEIEKGVNLATKDPNHLYHNWGDKDKMFAGNYIYGWNTELAWCLSFPDMKLVFSTGKSLKVEDYTTQIKELFNLKS